MFANLTELQSRLGELGQDPKQRDRALSCLYDLCLSAQIKDSPTLPPIGEFQVRAALKKAIDGRTPEEVEQAPLIS